MVTASEAAAIEALQGRGGREPVNRTDILERLGAMPGRLLAEARRTAEAEAGAGPPHGEFSAREAVGHLAAVEAVVWQGRLDALARAAETGAPEPAWPWAEPGVDADPTASTLDGALALFAARRAATLARLAALRDQDWSRAGLHATYGRVDVRGLLEIAADHDEEHLLALQARQGQSVSDVPEA